MNRIGIYGGSFNPIHQGHINLIKFYMAELCLDKLLIIPTSQPPHKPNREMISSVHRYKMLQLACSEIGDKAEVSDIELIRGGKSYTFDTIVQLQNIYPNSKFYLIMGSDMFLTIDSWYKADCLIKMVTISTEARQECDVSKINAQKIKLEQMGAEVIFLDNFDIFPISSTEIRNKIKNHQNIIDILPLKVAQYIYDENLYKAKL